MWEIVEFYYVGMGHAFEELCFFEGDVLVGFHEFHGCDFARWLFLDEVDGAEVAAADFVADLVFLLHAKWFYI